LKVTSDMIFEAF